MTIGFRDVFDEMYCMSDVVDGMVCLMMNSKKR